MQRHSCMRCLSTSNATSTSLGRFCHALHPQTSSSGWACRPPGACCCTGRRAAARPCWRAQQQQAARPHSSRCHAHRCVAFTVQWALCDGQQRLSHHPSRCPYASPTSKSSRCLPLLLLPLLLLIQISATVAPAAPPVSASAPGMQLYGMYVGEGEAALRDAFRRARLARPSIIFLDEADALAPRRWGGEAFHGRFFSVWLFVMAERSTAATSFMNPTH